MQYQFNERFEYVKTIEFKNSTSLLNISKIRFFKEEDISGVFSKKEFKYSFDNIIWTDWLTLTQSNVSSIDFKNYVNFWIQIRYTRNTLISGNIQRWYLIYDSNTSTQPIIPTDVSIDAYTFRGEGPEFYLNRENQFGSFLGLNLQNVIDGSSYGVYSHRLDTSLGTDFYFKRIEVKNGLFVNEDPSYKIIIDASYLCQDISILNLKNISQDISINQLYLNDTNLDNSINIIITKNLNQDISINNIYGYVDSSLLLRDLSINSIINKNTSQDSSINYLYTQIDSSTSTVLIYQYVDGSLYARDLSINYLYTQIDSSSSINEIYNYIDGSLSVRDLSINDLYNKNIFLDSSINSLYPYIDGSLLARDLSVNSLILNNLNHDISINNLDIKNSYQDVSINNLYAYVDGSLNLRDVSINSLILNNLNQDISINSLYQNLDLSLNSVYSYIDGSLSTRDLSINNLYILNSFQDISINSLYSYIDSSLVNLKSIIDVSINSLININLSQDVSINSKVSKSGDIMTGNLSVPNIIDVSTIKFLPKTYNASDGILGYDIDEGTLSFGLLDGGSIQMGKEVFDYYTNLSGVTLVDGDVVSIITATGNRMAVNLTNAKSILSAQDCIGIITSGNTHNNKVRVTKIGAIHNLNTNSWEEGDILYVDPSNNGKLINTLPTGSNNIIEVATVVVKHTNQGIIDVRLRVVPTLQSLSAINGTPLSTTGQVPMFHADTSVFDFDYNIITKNNQQDVSINNLYNKDVQIDASLNDIIVKNQNQDASINLLYNGAPVPGTNGNVVIIQNNMAIDSGLPYALILAAL